MATKRYKPTSPGRRNKQVSDFAEITQVGAEKSLLKKHKRNSGRSSTGQLVVRHKGGGAKRRFREIDFKRNKDGVPATVKEIHYDPNRSANIALLHYADGEKAYILAPNGIKVGAKIKSGTDAEIRMGNTLLLSDIPVGSIIHNVELKPGAGAKLVRSAGAYATLMAKNNQYATVKLPSGEVRLVHVGCKATLGQIGNTEKRNVVVGKAGTSRHMRKRPTVRGAVMNPCDHPHGGGEGRAPVGRSGPMTPWGKKAHGFKTRKRKHATDKYVVKRRT